eukprot:TRINITY_DN11534_c0_g1_i1.p1 TRINITY_DN11534_c0_g1~~TRINITY_DN11534_c0_g1_i1.p1  ORF type:complete len:369 (+),score=75.68 TRINITY_DN11534_c0_g1_i1:42-1109(+)
MNTHNSTSFKLLNSLTIDENTNIAISPLSINIALTMLLPSCTTGETADQLLDIFGPYAGTEKLIGIFSELSNQIQQGEEGVIFNIANGLFAKIDVKDDYTDFLTNSFDAEVGKLESVEQINGWVAEKTNQEITRIVNDLTDVVVIILNAIYFKGTWSDEFDETLTIKKPFMNYLSDQIEVDMMFKRGEKLDYANTNGVQICKIPYGASKDYYATILLPEGDINELVAALDEDEALWERLLHSTRRRKITLGFPKFDIEYTVDLVKSLKGMGVESLFRPGSLLNAVENPDVYVSDIVHKCVVKVDEKGTVAAAVTAVLATLSCCEVKAVSMICDRPFMFNVCYFDKVVFSCVIKNI